MTETIEYVCQEFGVSNPDEYALQFDNGIYVTEANRLELQQGMILVLTDSPVSNEQGCNNRVNISVQNMIL